MPQSPAPYIQSQPRYRRRPGHKNKVSDLMPTSAHKLSSSTEMTRSSITIGPACGTSDRTSGMAIVTPSQARALSSHRRRRTNCSRPNATGARDCFQVLPHSAPASRDRARHPTDAAAAFLQDFILHRQPAQSGLNGTGRPKRVTGKRLR